MTIAVLDDEVLAIQNMLSLLKQVEPDAVTVGFDDPDDMMNYLKNHAVDIAFLDIELGEDNGIGIAKQCKAINSQINVIFVTSHSQYTMEAFKLHASGYLIKPVRIADLRAEMENLRHPLIQLDSVRMRIQALGHFEVFVDEHPIKFPRVKCKECLAYLVDRKGARVTYPDLSAILWEDRPFDRTVQNNTQKVVSDLVKTLKAVNIPEVLIKSRHDIAVNTAMFDCDYYELLKKGADGIRQFKGEYMTNYSWSEFTLGMMASAP